MKELINTLSDRKHELELRKKELEFKLSEILKELTSINELLELHSGVSQYPIVGSLKEKVLFILSEVRSASYRDISELMLRHGDKVNLTSLKITCASLSRDGDIKIESTKGRTNIYSLWAQNTQSEILH